MKISIPEISEVNWKRRYVEVITTTAYPEYNGKKNHKNKGCDVSGFALVKMMARLAEKEAKVTQ